MIVMMVMMVMGWRRTNPISYFQSVSVSAVGLPSDGLSAFLRDGRTMTTDDGWRMTND